MKNLQPHCGKLISAKLKEKGQKISWLAKKVNCSRSNFYKILEKDDIGYQLLWNISDVLDYNFFMDIAIQFQKAKANS
ncbi:MAG: helix-turn-helix domain-containing protein [Prevotellaceae bacterium]|jgi:predicted transcriptional regulator|nr:helix-turn-helix domain-containing protein [Prevotellaceae bacterium]